MRVILASKSPRRRELLSALFPNFEIVTREVDETTPKGMHPSRSVELLALRKGEAVLPLVGEESIVISSDTLVERDGIPLGKPADTADAIAMLESLSGRAHNVHTGVAVHYRGKAYSGVDTTAVRFRPLTRQEIEEYVATGEPMDKAGAYGIQGIGGKFVEGYDGDFDTVVGLSMRLTKELVERAIAENANKGL